MEIVLDDMLRTTVNRLGAYSRDAFDVGLLLAGDGAGAACACALRPAGEPDEECRSFAAALAAAPTPRAHCPRGLSVVALPVAFPGHPGLTLLSHGFFESGDTANAPGGKAGAVPRLEPAEAGRLERFVGMGTDLLAALAAAATPPDPETAREAAWQDLLGAPGLVGASPAARELREALPAAAVSAEPLFVAGEPGSGRRFVAAAAHRLGPRAGRPFVAESLAALPEPLQEPELFGSAEFPGLLDEAGDGTVYLAAVERLTPGSQERLLERLSTGAEPGTAGPRVVSSSDADLDEAVRDGRFLAGLAERLRGRVVRVAPLRERVEDVPQIAQLLVRRRAAAAGTAPPELPRETLEVLKSRTWAGNVRELDDLLARAAAGRDVIRPGDVSTSRLPPASRPASSADATLREAVGDLETELIERALAGANWNKSRAARTLGLSRLGLQKKIDRYGIDRRR